MMGFTEDLLNCVVRDIEQNWERLDNYIVERGKVGPVCVTTVFNYIVHPIEDEKGVEA